MTVASINERAAEEYFRRGLESEQAADFGKAIDTYRRALNEDPDHEDTSFRLAVLLDRAGDDEDAIELYESLCAGGEVKVAALMNLAVLYEDNDRYEEAARCLRAVLESDPHHARAKLYLKDVESALSTTVQHEQRKLTTRDAVLDVPINDFELSVRSRNALKKMNVHTLGDLLKVSEQELMSFKNFGETSLSEIKSLLASRGLRLGQALEEGPVVASPVPAADFRAPAEDIPEELSDKGISEMELSVRSRKALQRLNIQTIGELCSRTEEELLGCKNFGQTSLSEIKRILASLGLHLRRLDD
ncbi:MAG: DNA-directed RNA polymerase subunit alpha C-terminal domain-containing protein [Planctomycetota bacterium]